MKTFTVEVLQDEGRPKTYVVESTTADDALQLAFALDGGWNCSAGKNGTLDGTDMLQLAKSYASIK